MGRPKKEDADVVEPVHDPLDQPSTIPVGAPLDETSILHRRPLVHDAE